MCCYGPSPTLWTKGPYLNDVYTFFGILDPLPPLVYILARSIRQNPRDLPYYVCILLTPIPPQCRRHLSMAPKMVVLGAGAALSVLLK